MLAGAGLTSATVSGETDGVDNESDENGEAFVRFGNQVTDGSYVIVEKVRFTTPGFVSIHLGAEFIGDNGGPVEPPTNIIGYSAFFEPGTYHNVEVPLFVDELLPAVDGTQSRLQEATVLVALPHEDVNGNEEWDFYSVEDPDKAYGFGDTDFAPPLNRTTDIAAVVPLTENLGAFDLSLVTRDIIARAKYDRDFDELSEETTREVEDIYDRQPFSDGVTAESVQTLDELAQERYNRDFEALSERTKGEIEAVYLAQFADTDCPDDES